MSDTSNILIDHHSVVVTSGKIVKLVVPIFLSIVIFGASACSSLEKARNTTDMIVANKNNLNIQALVQAEIERKRMRKLRCHSPLLSPTAISGAAFHPNLGQPWIDELLRDCPEYAAFIAELILRRAETAGVSVQGRSE